MNSRNPLRTPGQSLEEHRQGLIDKAVEDYLGAVVLGCFAAGAWIKVWLPSVLGVWLPSVLGAWALTILAAIVVARAMLKIRSSSKEASSYKLGHQGEVAVGQYLERMREDGAQVFHDLQGDGFNVDHVVVCSKGILVIETKTWSKPESGAAKITYDGTILRKNGMPVKDDPVTQVKAASNYVSGILKESTGKRFQTQPMLTFPGWYVDNQVGFHPGDVWPLSTKGLPEFIRNRKDVLPSSDISLIGYHLSRIVRTSIQP